MKKNIYKIDNSAEKVYMGKNTMFLDMSEFKRVKSKLKGINYSVYYPYKDSEKVIIYTNDLPDVTLFKINTNDILTHPSILGSIMSLNIDSHYLGDIIVDNNNYYFYIMSELKDYIKHNLISIGSIKITLKEIELSELENYMRKYNEESVIVSSLRIDNVISKIIKTNRENVLNKIKNDEVILNCEILSKNTYILKENDIFSIRRCGKYKYIGNIKSTKKDNYIIKYLKYI